MDLGASTVAQAGKPGFATRSTSEALRAGVQTFIRELWELDKPTVAAVERRRGRARRAPRARVRLRARAREARFMWTFPKWGLVVDAGGAYLLPRLVGLARAKAMVMLGESVDRRRGRRPRPRVPVRRPTPTRSRRAADDARAPARGRADAVARPVEAPAERVVRARPRRLARARRSLPGARDTSPDLVEGMAAFREKRDARFDGR